MYALSVIRYTGGVIVWPNEEIEATAIKTQKLLTMHREFQHMSNTLELYTKQKVGGRRSEGRKKLLHRLKQPRS